MGQRCKRWPNIKTTLDQLLRLATQIHMHDTCRCDKVTVGWLVYNYIEMRLINNVYAQQEGIKGELGQCTISWYIGLTATESSLSQIRNIKINYCDIDFKLFLQMQKNVIYMHMYDTI